MLFSVSKLRYCRARWRKVFLFFENSRTEKKFFKSPALTFLKNKPARMIEEEVSEVIAVCKAKEFKLSLIVERRNHD
jgi:hypothetical protein